MYQPEARSDEPAEVALEFGENGEILNPAMGTDLPVILQGPCPIGVLNGSWAARGAAEDPDRVRASGARADADRGGCLVTSDFW